MSTILRMIDKLGKKGLSRSESEELLYHKLIGIAEDKIYQEKESKTKMRLV